MALRKHSPTLHRPSPLGRRSRFPRRPSRLSPAALREAEQERALEEEVEKIKKVLLEICASLNRSSDRIDLSLESIDRNLAQIREQKEELEILKASQRGHSFGPSRPAALSPAGDPASE